MQVPVAACCWWEQCVEQLNKLSGQDPATPGAKPSQQHASLDAGQMLMNGSQLFGDHHRRLGGIGTHCPSPAHAVSLQGNWSDWIVHHSARTAWASCWRGLLAVATPGASSHMRAVTAVGVYATPSSACATHAMDGCRTAGDSSRCEAGSHDCLLDTAACFKLG